MSGISAALVGRPQDYRNQLLKRASARLKEGGLLA